MALRQRQWMIMIRPYYTNDEGYDLYYTGTPKAGKSKDLGSNSSINTAEELKGNGEGMEANNTLPIDGGGWVVWYTTTSFAKVREKYKECLITVGRQHTKIVEVIPADTLVTPIS